MWLLNCKTNELECTLSLSLMLSVHRGSSSSFMVVNFTEKLAIVIKRGLRRTRDIARSHLRNRFKQSLLLGLNELQDNYVIVI